MTQQKKMQSNTLSIIATAHKEKKANRVFLQSMDMQTCQKGWNAYVWQNGMRGDLLDSVCDTESVQYKNSDTDTGNWGTANRQRAIDECVTDYIIQTSIQDYWLPQSIEYILKAIERHSPDLIIWDSINHLVGPCKVLESALEWSKIDWGNFAIRTDIAKAVGINHGDQYCADWLFIQDVLNSGLVDEKKILKIPYILTIHN